MLTEKIHFTNTNTNKLLFMNQQKDGSTNKYDRSMMKQILTKAIFNELTDKQRICVIEYYFNHKKQKDIANELGIAVSTVSRHIEVGKKKLRNIASYYTRA